MNGKVAKNNDKEPMDRVSVCLRTAVRRFVRVRGCQADGIRAKLRTDDYVNHNLEVDNDNDNRNDNYGNNRHDYNDYNRNTFIHNNLDNRQTCAGR